MELTQARLKELLHYDPGTGVFTNIKGRGGLEAGAIAGNLNAAGYRAIRLDWKYYYGHRLAWLYVHGAFPVNHIDHRNGLRHDNRISNLRDATHSENQQNLVRESAVSKSGIRGVSWNSARKQWVSYIYTPDGVHKYLGKFTTIDEARQAYISAKKIHHPTSFLAMEANNDR